MTLAIDDSRAHAARPRFRLAARRPRHYAFPQLRRRRSDAQGDGFDRRALYSTRYTHFIRRLAQWRRKTFVSAS